MLQFDTGFVPSSRITMPEKYPAAQCTVQLYDGCGVLGRRVYRDNVGVWSNL